MDACEVSEQAENDQRRWSSGSWSRESAPQARAAASIAPRTMISRAMMTRRLIATAPFRSRNPFRRSYRLLVKCTLLPVGFGHAHDVDLDDTFDFLNTDDTENGFPVDRLPSLESALTWFVDRGVIHKEGADRTRAVDAGDEAAAAHALARIRAVRSALREVSLSLSAHEAPSPGALETINRALHARQVIELVPGPDGVHVDHRHVGDPVDDALARLADPLVMELTDGHPERIKSCASDTFC